MGRGISQRFLPFSTHTEASLPFFRFFSLFEKHGGYKTGKLKLKRPEQLQVRWWIWLAGAVLWKDRGQNESLASQDLASCVDTLLFPPGGAGHHTAAIGWTGERTRWWDRGEDGEIGAVKIRAADGEKRIRWLGLRSSSCFLKYSNFPYLCIRFHFEKGFSCFKLRKSF